VPLPKAVWIIASWPPKRGLSPKTLAAFLVGTSALDSVAIDKLAAFLQQELRPIG
jgi:hypothetical protein